MAIVIIGPPAVGKSLLGKLLASRLGLPFTDTDAMIEKRFGAIADLLDCEERFRELETGCIRRALSRGGVVATGGGAVLRRVNQKLLGRHRVVLLVVDPECVAGRLDSARPLTPEIDSWKRVWADRKATYYRLADVTLDVSNKSGKCLVLMLARLICQSFEKGAPATLLS